MVAGDKEKGVAKKQKIHSLYNITPVIVKAANDLGLDALATGGNTDFIMKKVGTNKDGSDRMVILTAADGGGTPDKLSEPSELILILDEEWHDQVGIPCGTARNGLNLMASMHDPYAPI